jgi:hypothetical protein
MADAEAPVDVRLPATAACFFFEEMQESLPTCVAYEHAGEFWWNLGYWHDNFHNYLSGDIEPSPKFTHSVRKKVDEHNVKLQLGQCMYSRPVHNSGRRGSHGQKKFEFLLMLFIKSLM